MDKRNMMKLFVLISFFSVIFLISNNNASANWVCAYNFTLNACQCKCLDPPICDGAIPFGDCSNTPLPNITMTSPQQESIYSTTAVAVAGTTSQKVKYVMYKIDLNPTPFLICSGCSAFSKAIDFKTQGSHSLTIEVTDYNNKKVSKTVQFKIDSIAPKTNGTQPENNKFIIGSSAETFTIVYDETNVMGASFFWKPLNQGNSSVYNSIPLNCPSGKMMSCSTTIDLSSYPEGTQINYYFEIQDNSNSIASQINTVTINKDLTVINIISPINGTTYNTTKIQIKVMTGNSIKSFMRSIDGSSFSLMCSNCNSFTKDIIASSLRQGMHNITVRYLDYSGNTKEKIVYFKFDNQAPKIISSLPANKSLTNGNFTITYREPNLKSAKVFWKCLSSSVANSSSSNYTEETLGCPSTSLQKTCSSIINLAGHDGHQIAYYFELSDDIYKTATPVRTLNADISAPDLNIVSPIATNYSKGAKVYLNLTLNEKAKTIMKAVDSNIYSTMCTNCNKTITLLFLKPGNHTLKIRATDNAGNTNYREVNFATN
ncbi:MAG TPA: hypothetical protein VI894_03860 [Candidatus Nanoarchaeia archaeon]|nr:hypothetical protein [Candidatus Nanoarchaeia archaeon]